MKSRAPHLTGDELSVRVCVLNIYIYIYALYKYTSYLLY